ncbi:hydrolase [Gordonia phage RedWattleHog]|uniref:Hydrolase n=1 Tax=Gordonia phage Stormageddon TaxID=2656541 RepID=A0A649VTY9_9CAUD|nr:hydrolase [Gordonia phage Stormageddon]QGJ95023.1 hydrolase [Gordonia phage Stormageddon]QLF83665.1 hydrolase [Gordonia phage RedWattleHog]
MAELNKPTAVLVDIDGTLCDVRTIRHYVIGPDKDFEAFHTASLHCPPHPQALDFIRNSIEDGHDVVFVSARQEKFRQITELFIAMHVPRVQWFGPFMREHGDRRPDVEVKRDIHHQLSKWWDIVGAIDDNPAIVALWRELGIPVEVVPGWDAGAAASYVQSQSTQ